MKVVATNKYQELGIMDSNLQRIPMEGEELEITEERYKVLSGDNSYKAIFVKPIGEYIQEVETAKQEPKTEKAVKKTTKKTTTKKTTKKKAE